MRDEEEQPEIPDFCRNCTHLNAEGGHCAIINQRPVAGCLMYTPVSPTR